MSWLDRNIYNCLCPLGVCERKDGPQPSGQIVICRRRFRPYPEWLVDGGPTDDGPTVRARQAAERDLHYQTLAPLTPKDKTDE